ncbi:arsenate reductase/protein-tyrosine-phosphatase family protein [Erythrobacter sp. Alg231-14]|uniref:arsenate reductase/protein-tyrosine-phosphatase family protein n=1 Tax=Erythrobacter sp. Alg231-14 TaxID=1922225 RepID=UPI000D5502E7
MEAPNNNISVLFVCLGNICRSPMAQGAMADAARKAGLDIRVDSVGTAAYHIGHTPDPRAIATARANGVDIGGLFGRQLTAQDFTDFTHIFALDGANMAGIKARAPRHSTARIAMLLDAVEGKEGTSVPDPYYGDEEGFVACWDLVNEAAIALIERFKRDGVDAEF